MDSTNLFTVTPMSRNIKLEAGQIYEGSITVANPVDAKNDFYYKVEVAPYGVIGEEYVADLSTQSNYSQIVEWIKIDNPTGKLAPNETAKVNFTITVPKTVQAGGQYAALAVHSNDEAVTDGNTMAVNNIFEIASIIYADIAGETVHDGEVLEVKIPGFVTNVPIPTSTTIINNGNTHEVAEISIEVKNAFSSTTIYSTDDEESALSEVIMPETTRYFTKDIDGMSPLGVYQVTQTVNYLGEDFVFSQTVIACPIWFMILLAIAMAAIVTTIARSIFNRRANKTTD